MNLRACLFASLAIVVVGSQTDCPENEEYSECDDHPCRNTCELPHLIASCSHAPGCFPGCVCREGFLRDARGECVPSRQCFECGANETFSECQSHGCYGTCSQPDLLTRCFPAPGCYPGCVCRDGYILNDKTGECISRDDCGDVVKCEKENETFEHCGSACRESCDKKRAESLICSVDCSQGCFCGEGYARDRRGNCVALENCS